MRTRSGSTSWTRSSIAATSSCRPGPEEEYDLAEWLSAYRKAREDFVDGSEIRDIFDAALSAIVVGDDLEADRLFLEAQVACFEREDEVNESFAGIEFEVRVALNVLEWFCHDWRERAGIDGDMDAGYRQAMEFSRRLDRRSDRSWVGRLWNFTLLGVMGLVVAVVIGFAMWLRERVGDAAIALPFVVLVLVIAGFQRGWFWRPLQLVSKPFVAWQSRKLWRPMTLDFLRESRVPFLLLVSVLEDEEAPTDAFVLQAVATDLSLGMHSIAARTLV